MRDSQLEGEQVVRENKIREQSHQYSIPGEKISTKTARRQSSQDQYM
jgi:hypothetical protein